MLAYRHRIFEGDALLLAVFLCTAQMHDTNARNWKVLMLPVLKKRLPAPSTGLSQPELIRLTCTSRQAACVDLNHLCRASLIKNRLGAHSEVRSVIVKYCYSALMEETSECSECRIRFGCFACLAKQAQDNMWQRPCLGLQQL